MKRIALFVVLVLMMVLPLSACGGGAGQQSQPSETVSEPAESSGADSSVSNVASGARGENSDDGEEETQQESAASDAAEDNSASQEASESGGILVAYFSHTNNTKVIAEQIQGQVGGDLFRIVSVDAYPEDYNECVDQARKELDENFRPVLQTSVESMDSYDVIYLGYPNWWSTIPMPVATFLESYDFSGKTIIPFCTHGGGRLGSSESYIAELAPQATMLAGFETSGGSVNSAGDKVTAWLRELGQIQ